MADPANKSRFVRTQSQLARLLLLAQYACADPCPAPELLPPGMCAALANMGAAAPGLDFTLLAGKWELFQWVDDPRPVVPDMEALRTIPLVTPRLTWEIVESPAGITTFSPHIDFAPDDAMVEESSGW